MEILIGLALVTFAFIAGVAAGAIYFTIHPFNEKIKTVERQPYFPPRVASHDVPHPHQHPNGMPR